MRSIFSTSLILAGFLFSCSVASGQSKFAFSATVAPVYAHTKNKVTVVLPAYDGSGTLTSEVWKSKYSQVGYMIGLNGRYSFSQKWSASTGLWFKEFRSMPFASGSRSYNFSLPVMVNLQTSERKLSPYFSAGALWNFETTSHVNITDIGTVIFKSDRNTARISTSLGAGIIYHFAPHLSLIAQPTFSYTLPPSGYNSHAYQLSLNFQLMFKF